ncbi:MAG TPA: methyltransferase [Vicinamibacterales bacterium]|jgi:protein-S-isoprenylcysteine O-methyltransferase Ste14|nr:methyltransferase [Vicinamibacterales bacterium]
MSVVQRAFAWAGGVLFVASLGWCTWWFLFALGRRQPPSSWPPFVVDAILVTIFALHHSVFAREPVKRAMTAAIPEGLLRPVYVWIASVLLILVCVLWQPLGGELYDIVGWRALALAAVQVAGIVVIVQSVRTIDPLELAGIRPPAGAEGLQTRGVYGLVRHPIYFGWALAVFGAAHMTRDRFFFAVLTTMYLAIAVRWEERSLVRSFGEPYRRYQQRVRWRMIPFIY